VIGINSDVNKVKNLCIFIIGEEKSGKRRAMSNREWWKVEKVGVNKTI